MSVLLRALGLQAAYAVLRTMSPGTARWTSGLLLLAANALPLLALLSGEWKAGDVLIAFWLENVAIGAWTVVRMATTVPSSASAGGGFVWHGAPGLGLQGRPAVAALVSKVFLVGFFTVHYGAFTFVHGIFTAVISRSAGVTGSFRGYLLLLLALLLSHGLSTVIHWFARGERRGAHPQRVMFWVYPRVVVMHVSVIAAAFLLTGSSGSLVGAGGGLGDPDPGSESLLPGLVLIGIKTVVDIVAHLRHHLAAAATSSPVPEGIR